MSVAVARALIARNPASGATLGQIDATPPDSVAGMVERARRAQVGWSARSLRDRLASLGALRGILARDADAWAAAIRDEVGKPTCEALGEVLTSLDGIRWTLKHARATLADRRVGPGWQRAMLLPTSRQRWAPLGVVGMIGTWNYPLLLNGPPIVQALAAGNAVVWKPSELAPSCGERLRSAIEEAGLPDGLVATAFGGPEVGEALIATPIDKGVFTGGITAGRRVLADLASRGIPAVAELSGFDAAIVLPDAPLEATARALGWAAFVGAGQTCVAVKRAYIVGDPRPWAEALADLAHSLRIGDPASPDVDLGPMISESARDRFDGQVRAAVDAGARVLAGGQTRPGPGSFYEPTVLLANNIEPEARLAGGFGPVVIVRGVGSEEEAIVAANSSEFGLAASVWGRDHRRARHVAERLQAGMIWINDAVTPSASASAPFGGVKASGHGRTRGPFGLREFASPQVFHERRPGGFRPHIFPYRPQALGAMRLYLRIFHGRGD